MPLLYTYMCYTYIYLPVAAIVAAGRYFIRYDYYYRIMRVCENRIRFQGRRRRRLQYISGKSTVLYAVYYLYCMRYAHAAA